MSFFLLSWGKVILERMSFGLWIVSYFVTFKVQATAVKLQSVATPVLHESPMPAPATGSDGLTLWAGSRNEIPRKTKNKSTVSKTYMALQHDA